MANPGRPRKCESRINNLRRDIASDKFDIAKQVLQEFGIDATDGDGRTALLNAVIESKPTFISWLIGNNANINHQDRIGYSALHFAGQNKLVELTKYLLISGADPNLQDAHGNSALWTAIFNAGQSPEGREIITLLLRNGANPNTVNNYDRSPAILYQTLFGADITAL